MLGSGMRIHHWSGTDRLVVAPPQAERGPYTEMRLAPSPVAAVAAAIGRRRASSEQPIWRIVQDVQGSAVYAVRATGVRIKDRHSDSHLVGGTRALRKEGENARSRLVREDRELVASRARASTEEADGRAPMSEEWMTLDAYFEEQVAAVEIPSDSGLRTIKADWCLVASIPRLEKLEGSGALQTQYLGTGVVGLRDLLSFRDVEGEPAGGRFAYYLAREAAHDVFSLRRQSGLRDWLRFFAASLGSVSSLGGLGWLLSRVGSLFS